jgi:hypothetical protein
MLAFRDRDLLRVVARRIGLLGQGIGIVVAGGMVVMVNLVVKAAMKVMERTNWC